MDKDHPHAGATYCIHQQSDSGYGVEVAIPNMHPTLVTGFATQADAEAWIVSHKHGIASGNSLRRKTFYPQKR